MHLGSLRAYSLGLVLYMYVTSTVFGGQTGHTDMLLHTTTIIVVKG